MTYWEKRQQQLNRQMEKDEEKLKKRLSSYFDTEYRKLEKQIAAYYKQYGTDNVIQYRRLMEELPDEDKRLLIEQMDQFAAKYPEYAHLIPVRESIYKLNRLEGLQYSVRMQQLEIGAVENEQITAHLNRQAMRGANAAAEALGFGKNFYSNNPDITKLFVNVSWSNGDNFSERIWGNTSKLAYYLNTDIAQGIARGDSYDRLVKRLRKRFGDVSRNDAYRLIYTEGTYVMAEATMQPFVEDFQKYRLSTVGDADVCDICRGVASEVFDIADRQPGVNFPPLHPWCRCTFTIEVDDWDAWMEDYERRHGNDEAQKVADRLGKSALGQVAEDELIRDLKERYGVEVDISQAGNRSKEALENLQRLRTLLDQYDSTIVSYSVTKNIPGTEGGSAYMLNGRTAVKISVNKLRRNKATDTLKLGDNQIFDVTYHEFAHTLSQSREKIDKEFWKEIRRLKREYQKERDGANWFKVKISDYAEKDADEFLAEGFTQAKLSSNPSPYSKRIEEIVDKYFARSVEKESNSGIMKLPRYQEAVIPKAKFTQYAMNPDKDPDKARAFKSALGYDLDNANDLIEQINAKLPEYEAVSKGDRGWGMTYEVVMDITGPNGKTAKVLTAWIDDKNNGEMRLTTVHVDD